MLLELIGRCAPLAKVAYVSDSRGRQLIRRHQVWWTAGLEPFRDPGGGACWEVVVFEKEEGECAEDESEEDSGLGAGAARQALREGHAFGRADGHAWGAWMAGSGSVGRSKKSGAADQEMNRGRRRGKRGDGRV